MSSAPVHPCLRCGACCQNYRVEFSVYELQSMGGAVPDTMAHEVTGNRWRMNGTQQHPARCVALQDLGNGCMGCTIYEHRPRPCRDFPFASHDCGETRQKFGLPPLPEEQPAAALEYGRTVGG